MWLTLLFAAAVAGLLGLLVCFIGVAGWTLWKWSQSLQTLTQGFRFMSELNEEMNGRVRERVKLVNRSRLPTEPELPPMGTATMQNYGADVHVTDQPSQDDEKQIISSIRDEASEILREMTRPRTPGIEWTKRENFADHMGAEHV